VRYDYEEDSERFLKAKKLNYRALKRSIEKKNRKRME